MTCSRCLFLVLGWLLPICLSAQVRIELVRLPELQVPGAPLYLASDLNNWNPGDADYKFTREAGGRYSLVLPQSPDHFSFKITQGQWTLVEGDSKGNPRANHEYVRTAEPNPNHIQVAIDGWERRIGYTFVVREIPKNTPVDASLYLSGNFNNWNAADPFYQLKPFPDGTYRVTLVTEEDRVEYKFTRGSWLTVEGRESGKARPNRMFFRSVTDSLKPIEVKIAGWEDLTGAFHFFSLYDLLLLFSAFLGLLLIASVSGIPNYNRRVNRWLLASLALASVMLTLRVLGSYREVAQAFTKILLLPDFGLFLYGPFFYIYLHKLLFGQKNSGTRGMYHFVPALALFFVYLPYLLMNPQDFQFKIINQELTLQLVFLGVGGLAWLWNGYYWLRYRRAVRLYRDEYKTHPSYEPNLQYLRAMLFIQAMCLSLWLFLFVFLGVGKLASMEIDSIVERIIDGVWLLFSFITYFVGYFAVNQPDMFKTSSPPFLLLDEEPKTVPVNPVRVPVKAAEEPVESLAPLMATIESFVQKHKPYTNPQLTVNELAAMLKLPPHTLSKAINEGFGKNFFDFINTYRVDEFKRRVEDPHYRQFTLLGIAYEVGFNSKSAFNRSFKKITGQTPREYFQLAQEPDEIPS